MKMDKITFIGRPEMVKRFEKLLKKNFNVSLPDSEIRMAKINLVQVVYSVNHANTPYFNSAEALEQIAAYAVQQEFNHNAYANNCYWYKVKTEG